MSNNLPQNDISYKKELKELDQLLKGKKKLLVIAHNNPDPDAIGTAAALAYLVEKRNQLEVSIAYGGNIGRAENEAMVRILKIHLKQLSRIKFNAYDLIALVDTQPGAGNNSLPSESHCHIVIDHHPRRKGIDSEFVLIKPEIGVTATIVTEMLQEAGIDLPANLATALSYAISSETQNLGRETTNRDIQAYLSVYVKSSVRKLAQIMHPKLPRSYFVMLAKTLQRTVTFRNLICANLGAVDSVEIISEMADFLLRQERIGWSYCTGRFKKNLYISIRSSKANANAGRLLKQLVSDTRNVGGHGMTAGGYVEVKENGQATLSELELRLLNNFARLMGYKEPDWKPLVNSVSKQ